MIISVWACYRRIWLVLWLYGSSGPGRTWSSGPVFGLMGASVHPVEIGSRRVHSCYHRGLADGSVAGQLVMLRSRMRRFFCDTNDCTVRTFAEQVDGLTVKHARRTLLCRDMCAAHWPRRTSPSVQRQGTTPHPTAGERVGAT